MAKYDVTLSREMSMVVEADNESEAMSIAEAKMAKRTRSDAWMAADAYELEEATK
jgi:hypothetical protein